MGPTPSFSPSSPRLHGKDTSVLASEGGSPCARPRHEVAGHQKHGQVPGQGGLSPLVSVLLVADNST